MKLLNYSEYLEGILLSDEGLEQMKNDCLDMLKAIIWMLDGAKYLWQGTEKSPDSGNC